MRVHKINVRVHARVCMHVYVCVQKTDRLHIYMRMCVPACTHTLCLSVCLSVSPSLYHLYFSVSVTFGCA